MKIQALFKAAEFIDLMNKRCLVCNNGTYQEESSYDAVHGVLHCDACGVVTRRYLDKSSKAYAPLF